MKKLVMIGVKRKGDKRFKIKKCSNLDISLINPTVNPGLYTQIMDRPIRSIESTNYKKLKKSFTSMEIAL